MSHDLGVDFVQIQKQYFYKCVCLRAETFNQSINQSIR